MPFVKTFSSGALTVLSALVLCVMLAPGPAEAATCALFDGKWKCGGATLKAAKGACNATTGRLDHSCDAGINVCTCATKSTKGGTLDLSGLDNGKNRGMTKPPRQ